MNSGSSVGAAKRRSIQNTNNWPGFWRRSSGKCAYSPRSPFGGDRMQKLLRLAAVKELTGLSRSTIYADPDFPKPVKLSAGRRGRAVGWVEQEISDWIVARIDEREAA